LLHNYVIVDINHVVNKIKRGELAKYLKKKKKTSSHRHSSRGYLLVIGMVEVKNGPTLYEYMYSSRG
jgi:hypothetical protein